MATPERKVKSYSWFELIFGNLALILWIALGAISWEIVNVFAGLAYFAVIAFLIFFEIGKHGCVTCYYCKTCTIGIGKLPEFFFKTEGTANVNRRAQRIFSIVFVLLSVLPLVLVVFSMVNGLTAYNTLLLVAILVFSLYTGIVRRRTLVT